LNEIAIAGTKTRGNTMRVGDASEKCDNGDEFSRSLL
jgi:hypothetical protein